MAEATKCSRTNRRCSPMCVTTTPTITMTNNHSTKDLPFIFMTRPPRAPRVRKCWADPAICPATQLLGIIRQRCRCRLDRVIPDQAHLGQQVGHLHARERFEQRRYLRRDFCDVAGELVSARRVSVSCRYDGHLVDLAERLGKSAHHFRQASD